MVEILNSITFLIKINHYSIYLFLIFIGLSYGSFLNVVIYRYPNKIKYDNLLSVKDYFEELGIEICTSFENYLKKFPTNSISLSNPPSHCTSCDSKIKWYDNIPLLSYLLLGGKCRNCKVHISSQYPLVELTTAIFITSTFYLFREYEHIYIILMFFIIGWTLLLIDLKTYILPDTLNYFLLWAGLLLAALNYQPFGLTLQDSLYGAVVGYIGISIIGLIGKAMKKTEAVGQGDYKLIAALGAFIGVKGIIFTLLFSPFPGILTWVLISLYQKVKNQEINNRLPFGPALIISAWIFIINGENIIKSILKI